MPSSGIKFSETSDDSYISVFDRKFNPPIADDLRGSQQKDIAQELQKIEELLTPYTDEKMTALEKAFQQAWEAEKAKDAPGYNRVTIRNQEYVWRDIENSFWALPVRYNLRPIEEVPITPNNLKALMALRDFLESNGCQLLIVIVPNSHDIAARVINKEFRLVPDFYTASIARQLLKHGIWTFYPSETLIQNFNRFQWAFFYPRDGHPSDTAQDVLTDIVAQKLSHHHFPNTLEKKLFSYDFVPHIYQRDKEYLLPEKCDIGKNRPNTAYKCRRILYDGKVVLPDPQSPVLVIGNSMMQTPMSYPESFPTILSSKINIRVSSYWVGGNGPMFTIVQQFFSSPQTMLAGKNVVILVMGASHLTSSIEFNNIRDIDDYAKAMSEKEMIKTFNVQSNITGGIDKFYSGLLSPNFIEIPAERRITLFEDVLRETDHRKPITIVIPTCSKSGNKVKYFINGKEISIPECHGQARHLNILHDLPAGTTELKVEAVGKPGRILSVRNVQIYQ